MGGIAIANSVITTPRPDTTQATTQPGVHGDASAPPSKPAPSTTRRATRPSGAAGPRLARATLGRPTQALAQATAPEQQGGRSRRSPAPAPSSIGRRTRRSIPQWARRDRSPRCRAHQVRSAGPPSPDCLDIEPQGQRQDLDQEQSGQRPEPEGAAVRRIPSHKPQGGLAAFRHEFPGAHHSVWPTLDGMVESGPVPLGPGGGDDYFLRAFPASRNVPPTSRVRACPSSPDRSPAQPSLQRTPTPPTRSGPSPGRALCMRPWQANQEHFSWDSLSCL